LPKIKFVTSAGDAYILNVRVGGSVMEAAVANGVPGIEAQCYGACNCGTCHVFVDAMWREKLSEISEQESALLAALPLANEASRLSCQIGIRDDLDGLVLRVPEFQS
jgi:2Fe-2S ferredoxin